MSRRPASRMGAEGADEIGAAELVADMRRAADDLVGLVDALRHLARNGDALLRRELATHPYGTLAAAAAVGYVLGGGVRTQMARMALRIGGRLALERALARLVDPPRVEPDRSASPE